jgi:hypothetical protein
VPEIFSTSEIESAYHARKSTDILNF